MWRKLTFHQLTVNHNHSLIPSLTWLNERRWRQHHWYPWPQPFHPLHLSTTTTGLTSWSSGTWPKLHGHISNMTLFTINHKLPRISHRSLATCLSCEGVLITNSILYKWVESEVIWKLVSICYKYGLKYGTVALKWSAVANGLIIFIYFLPSPPFLCQMPLLAQPSEFIMAWDRHRICWLAYPVAWFIRGGFVHTNHVIKCF